MSRTDTAVRVISASPDRVFAALTGSITITICRTEPTEPAAPANWLPGPAGESRPILRMYNPNPQVLDGSYRIPPIQRQD